MIDDLLSFLFQVLDELDLTKVMFKGRKIGKAVVKLSTMEGAKNCKFFFLDFAQNLDSFLLD